MNVIIRSHHATVGDDLREHAEQKLAKLERYLPRAGDAVVEVARTDTRSAADRYTVQITVRSGGSVLRAEEHNGDPATAFDLAAGVIGRQAQRHAERLHDRHKLGPAKDLGEPGGADAYAPGEVVRVKRFEAKPMSQEEALAQMDLLGHDFFLFFDASTNQYAVLYKRREGGYGLLQPGDAEE